MLKELVGSFVFKDGTDDTGTVRNPLDKDGGRLALLHDNEQIWSKKDRSEIGFRSRDEVKDIVSAYDQGILPGMAQPALIDNSMAWQSNEAILSKFDSIEKRLEELPYKMPRNEQDFDVLTGVVKDMWRYGNKKDTRHVNIRNRMFGK